MKHPVTTHLGCQLSAGPRTAYKPHEATLHRMALHQIARQLLRPWRVLEISTTQPACVSEVGQFGRDLGS